MTRSTKRLSMNSMDELPAFPEGWYFVASRESILREKTDREDVAGRGNRRLVRRGRPCLRGRRSMSAPGLVPGAGGRRGSAQLQGAAPNPPAICLRCGRATRPSSPPFELASLIAEASVYFVIWIVGQTGVVEVRFNAIGNRRDGAPVQV